MKRLCLLLCAAFVIGCAAKPHRSVWHADHIASADAGSVMLVDETLGHRRMSVGTVRNLLEVKRAVEEAIGTINAELLILADDHPNAFAFRAGNRPSMAISLGMIELLRDDRDALAALFGHELAHLYHHAGRRDPDREDAQEIVSAVAAIALTLVGVPFAAAIGGEAAGTVVQRSYSRDDEREADRLSVGYLLRAGFDPRGAVRLQEKLARAGSDSALAILSTHPSGEERVDSLRALVAEYERAGPSR